jgi:hypothetical protein
MGAWRLLPWLIIYAIAMAHVESAVVLYLRAIYHPQGFVFPVAPMEPGIIAIEMGREVATLVMLLGVAMLAGTERWDRFLAFCVSFVSGTFTITSGCGSCWAGRPPCSPGTCSF